MATTPSLTDLIAKLQTGELSADQFQSALTNNIASGSNKASGVTMKVTDKGCIGFYGIRRMPITLYEGELCQLLQALLQTWDPAKKLHDSELMSEEFQAWYKENYSKLSRK